MSSLSLGFNVQNQDKILLLHLAGDYSAPYALGVMDFTKTYTVETDRGQVVTAVSLKSFHPRIGSRVLLGFPEGDLVNAVILQVVGDYTYHVQIPRSQTLTGVKGPEGERLAVGEPVAVVFAEGDIAKAYALGTVLFNDSKALSSNFFIPTTHFADLSSIFGVFQSESASKFQTHYRWYENDDAENPSPLASLDTAYSFSDAGKILRLRMALDATEAWAGWNFKLQYAQSEDGPWTDVGASALWKYYDGLGVDKSFVANLLLSPYTGTKEHFVESEPSAEMTSLYGGFSYDAYDDHLPELSAYRGIACRIGDSYAYATMEYGGVSYFDRVRWDTVNAGWNGLNYTWGVVATNGKYAYFIGKDGGAVGNSYTYINQRRCSDWGLENTKYWKPDPAPDGNQWASPGQAVCDSTSLFVCYYILRRLYRFNAETLAVTGFVSFSGLTTGIYGPFNNKIWVAEGNYNGYSGSPYVIPDIHRINATTLFNEATLTLDMIDGIEVAWIMAGDSQNPEGPNNDPDADPTYLYVFVQRIGTDCIVKIKNPFGDMEVDSVVYLDFGTINGAAYDSSLLYYPNGVERRWTGLGFSLAPESTPQYQGGAQDFAIMKGISEIVGARGWTVTNGSGKTWVERYTLKCSGGEWDYCIQRNGAEAGSWFFRVVKSDGRVLNYLQLAELTANIGSAGLSSSFTVTV